MSPRGCHYCNRSRFCDLRVPLIPLCLAESLWDEFIGIRVMPWIMVNSANIDVDLVALLYDEPWVTRESVILGADSDQDG